MIDLGSASVSQQITGVVLERKSGGAYDEDGEWSGEVVTPTAIAAAVQPISSGNGLRDLSEGERNEAEYFLWTKTPLVTDDVVLYAGFRLRIMKVWDRTRDGGYVKALLGQLR